MTVAGITEATPPSSMSPKAAHTAEPCGVTRCDNSVSAGGWNRLGPNRTAKDDSITPVINAMKIGRASCRERVSPSEGARSGEKDRSEGRETQRHTREDHTTC